jgi:hypothetical protein
MRPLLRITFGCLSVKKLYSIELETKAIETLSFLFLTEAYQRAQDNLTEGQYIIHLIDSQRLVQIE